MKLKDKLIKSIFIICFVFFNISCMAENTDDKKYEKIILNIEKAKEKGKILWQLL